MDRSAKAEKADSDTFTICFVAPKAMNETLEHIAADMGLSKSDIIRLAIKEWISSDLTKSEIYESYSASLANSTG